MTMLNTCANLGGQWPAIMVFKVVELLGFEHCDADNNCQVSPAGLLFFPVFFFPLMISVRGSGGRKGYSNPGKD